MTKSQLMGWTEVNKKKADKIFHFLGIFRSETPRGKSLLKSFAFFNVIFNITVENRT